MKKLILFLGLLFIMIGVEAQTGTIVDNGTYIAFNYTSGDTVCLGKENIVFVKTNGSEQVSVMTNHSWRSDRITRIIQLDPDDFGYSSAGDLRDYVAAISFRAYLEAYSYDNGNLDTVSYYQGSDLQYQIVYGYTGGIVTSKSIITP